MTTKMVLRMALILWFLFVNAAEVSGQQQYRRRPGGRRRGNQRRSLVGGARRLWSFLVSSLASFSLCKIFRSNKKVKKARKQQDAELQKMKRAAYAVAVGILHNYEQQIKALHDELLRKDAQALRLEEAMFRLPDTNRDNLIDRKEFDAYMSKFKAMHPHVRGVDLPRFEDMDHDRSGKIRFDEWEQYFLETLGL